MHPEETNLAPKGGSGKSEIRFVIPMDRLIIFHCLLEKLAPVQAK